MAGDMHYGNVSLLLHCNGTDNSTTFIDSSRTTKTVSSVNGAKISNAQSKFGGSSGYFDGSNDYLTAPASSDFVFGMDDFTIEAWIYLPANPTGLYAAIIDIRNTGAGAGSVLFMLDSSRTLGYYGASTVRTSQTVPLNQWTHVALSRQGGTSRLFIDGVVGASVSDTDNKSSLAIPHIGSVHDKANPAFYGYINDLRVTKGIARYTTNFTPLSVAFSSYQSQIPGTLTESLAATTFVAEAHDTTTGVLVGTKAFTGANFTVDIKTTAKACNVTVRIPYKIWTLSTYYALNDLVFPSDPLTTPYYYKRIAVGTSGATEPTWAITPGAQVDDGAITDAWELVERLVQPITHGPLIPS